MKILLIEDDDFMRQNTKEILELARYEVLAVENGKKGIQALETFKANLIVCDIMMPELDGYGVLHILSKNPVTASIPFIFLSAKAEKSEIRKGMELGADDYLSKPFEETELLKAIECRIKKNEILKKEYAPNVEGLEEFLKEAEVQGNLHLLSPTNPILHYKKKEVIFHEGDHPTHLFFLNSGKVKISKLHNDGKEYIVGFYGKGDFFGYISLLKEVPYCDSAIALEDCEVCKIPKDDFSKLIYQNSAIANQFIKMLSNRVFERENQLMSFAYDTVRKRVARALLILSNRANQIAKNKTHILITRDDLASMVGTVAETVIRCLSDFKVEKLIEILGREIIILDAEGLKRIP